MYSPEERFLGRFPAGGNEWLYLYIGMIAPSQFRSVDPETSMGEQVVYFGYDLVKAWKDVRDKKDNLNTIASWADGFWIKNSTHEKRPIGKSVTFALKEYKP